MDSAKAFELEQHLKNKKIDRWTIDSLIDNGKSAAVFLAHEGKKPVALKIFDDELITRFGGAVQLARIERELELVGHKHPNLVQLIGGGIDPSTNNHFIVMEYLKGPNLKKALEDIPGENVPSLISQLAAGAEYLDSNGYTHRDIKPENIVVLDNYTRLVLLDFGVLRPLKGSDLTDADGIQSFVGTLQYSSPEFLLRQEDGSAEGWRSLSFYQIGGVLHDLIMRRPLFEEFANPYARLVNAVQHATPEIQNSALPYYLIELARCCLLKDWKKRLNLVNWRSFDQRPEQADTGESAKQRVTNRAVIAKAEASDDVQVSVRKSQEAERRLLSETIKYLKAAVRTIRAGNPMFPPLRITPQIFGGAGFGITFTEAPMFALGEPLTVLVKVEVIDIAAKIILLCCSAYVGVEMPSPEEAEASCTPFFRGTFDISILHQGFENCIYDLVDQAQQEGTALSKWIVPRGVLDGNNLVDAT